MDRTSGLHWGYFSWVILCPVTIIFAVTWWFSESYFPWGVLSMVGLALGSLSAWGYFFYLVFTLRLRRPQASVEICKEVCSFDDWGAACTEGCGVADVSMAGKALTHDEHLCSVHVIIRKFNVQPDGSYESAFF